MVRRPRKSYGLEAALEGTMSATFADCMKRLAKMLPETARPL